MEYICNDCGEIFDENDAEVSSYDIEDDLGVGDLFVDHHTATCFVCPECGSDDIEEYEGVSEDNESEE